MPDESLIKSVTVKEFDNEAAPYALDLTAAFFIIEDDIKELLDKAAREEWEVGRLRDEIGSLLK